MVESVEGGGEGARTGAGRGCEGGSAGGEGAGPRRDRLRTPVLIGCYRRLPGVSVFGNRLTTLLCISHIVLLLSEDQFFCFTMSYTAMFEF